MSDLNHAISDALRAHGAWKLRLKTGIAKGSLELPADDISQNNLCAFGKWLEDAARDPAIAGLPEFAEVQTLHTNFHKLAGFIAKRIEDNNVEGAARKLNNGQFDHLSHELAAALQRLKKAA